LFGCIQFPIRGLIASKYDLPGSDFGHDLKCSLKCGKIRSRWEKIDIQDNQDSGLPQYRWKKGNLRPRRRFPGAYSLFYEAGGSGSLKFWTTGTGSFFLRRVKKPTAIGMTINIKDRQIKPMPTGIGKVCCPVSTPFTLVLNGVPLAIIPPQMHDIIARHPQQSAVITVTTIAVVRFISASLAFLIKMKRILFSIQQKPGEI
jgi:hypothetical protein